MLGIRFYAYSPLAGGLLVGTEKLRDTATRAGYRQGLANMMGGSGEAGAAALEAALLKIEGACADAGVPMRDAALCWLFHHSPLGAPPPLPVSCSLAFSPPGSLRLFSHAASSLWRYFTRPALPKQRRATG